MRLMIVTESLRGGLGAAAVEHARRMSDHGTVTLVGPASQQGESPSDLEYVGAPMGPSFAASLNCKTLRALRAIFSREGPDIVHAHGMRSFALLKLAGIPSFVTLHGAESLPDANPVKRLVTTATMRLVPYFARTSISVAPHAPPGWKFIPHASPALTNLTAVGPGRDPVFAWVGRLDRQKRPDVFIRGIAATRGRARGLIYGDGPLRDEMQHLIETLDADVQIVGHVKDLHERLRSARAVVTISHFEGVPFSIEEAMWMAKPVIVSDLPGTRWLVGDAGFYADSTEETRAAMESLLDWQTAEQNGNRASIRVRSLIDLNAPWGELFDLYQRYLRRI